MPNKDRAFGCRCLAKAYSGFLVEPRAFCIRFNRKNARYIIAPGEINCNLLGILFRFVVFNYAPTAFYTKYKVNKGHNAGCKNGVAYNA